MRLKIAMTVLNRRRSSRGVRPWLRLAFVTIPGVAFHRAFRMALRHSKIFLITCFLATSLLSMALAKLHILVSIPEMLDPASEGMERFESVEKSFSTGDALTLSFHNTQKAPLSNAQLCAIKRVIHQISYQRTDIRSVSSLFHIPKLRFNQSDLTMHYIGDLERVCDMPPALSDQSAKAAAGKMGGLIISPDASHTIAEFQVSKLEVPGIYGKFNVEAVKEIQNLASDLLRDHKDLILEIQGPSAFKWYFIESLTADSVINTVVSLILIIAMRLLFGTWKSGFLTVFSLVITTTLLVSMMSLCGTPLDILTNCLFVVIALSATEDMLYVAAIQRRESSHWRAPFRKLLLPSFYTSLTTFVGFISLCLSDILPIRRLGLWAGIGAMVEWGVAFYVIPAAMNVFPYLRTWVNREDRLVNRAIERLGKIPPIRAVALVLLFGIAAGVYGFTHLRSNDSVESMWPSNHPFSASLKTLETNLGWKGNIDVIFNSNISADEVRHLVNEISAKTSTGQVDSAVRAESAIRPDLIPDVLYPTVKFELESSSPFRRYIGTTGNYRRAIFYLPDLSLDAVISFKSAVESVCHGRCFTSGDVVAMSQFSVEVIRTLIDSFIVSLAIVSIIIFILATALNSGNQFRLLISSMWGPVVLIGSVPLLMGGINFVTCVFAAVLVGLAGDSAIQFIFATRNGNIAHSVDSNQSAAISVCLTLAISSLAYLTSSFLQPRDLGLLFFGGYIVLLVGDVWLLKNLLAWKLPRISISQYRRQGWKMT
jgi:predicted RND superfamily exporter protein